MLSRVHCGCVDGKNGVGHSELSVDNVDGELDLGGSCNTECGMNCP